MPSVGMAVALPGKEVHVRHLVFLKMEYKNQSPLPSWSLNFHRHTKKVEYEMSGFTAGYAVVLTLPLVTTGLSIASVSPEGRLGPGPLYQSACTRTNISLCNIITNYKGLKIIAHVQVGAIIDNRIKPTAISEILGVKAW